MSAKKTAWTKLISTVDDDSWGTPYRVVMSRLRPSGPSIVESMEVTAAIDVINVLFPEHREIC